MLKRFFLLVICWGQLYSISHNFILKIVNKRELVFNKKVSDLLRKQGNIKDIISFIKRGMTTRRAYIEKQSYRHIAQLASIKILTDQDRELILPFLQKKMEGGCEDKIYTLDLVEKLLKFEVINPQDAIFFLETGMKFPVFESMEIQGIALDIFQKLAEKEKLKTQEVIPLLQKVMNHAGTYYYIKLHILDKLEKLEDDRLLTKENILSILTIDHAYEADPEVAEEITKMIKKRSSK